MRCKNAQHPTDQYALARNKQAALALLRQRNIEATTQLRVLSEEEYDKLRILLSKKRLNGELVELDYVSIPQMTLTQRIKSWITWFKCRVLKWY